MSGKRGSFIKELILLSLLPLILFGCTVTIVNSIIISRALYTETEQNLGSLAFALRNTCSVIYPFFDTTCTVNDIKPTDESADGFFFVDSIKAYSGIDATVFLGDTRFFTTIRNSDGSRAIGTQASKEVVQAVLGNGENFFSDHVSVNGVPFFGYYIPLHNNTGTIIGMIFTGKPRDTVLYVVAHNLRYVILITAFILIISSVFCVIYAKHIIFSINKIKDFLSHIASGNVRETLDEKVLNCPNEIGEIGNSALVLQRSLIDLIGTDPLTHLPNRRSCSIVLENLLQDSKKHGSSFSVAMGDIDNFKNVNDTYGHQCGDELLKSLGKLFIEHMENKGFVFRWGGEEFLFVYENQRLDEVRSHMESLLSDIRSMDFSYKGKLIAISMTCGLAEYGGNRDLELLIKVADDNLYWGKAHGKNQVVDTAQKFQI